MAKMEDDQMPAEIGMYSFNVLLLRALSTATADNPCSTSAVIVLVVTWLSIDQISAPAICHLFLHEKSSANLSNLFYRSRNRVNGATQTFRRPSLATNTSSTKESNAFSQTSATPTSGVYVPPHLNAHHQTNGSIGEARYTKEQMIAVYKQQRDGGSLDQNLTSLFTGGWNPREPREPNPSAWGRKDDAKDLTAPGPEVCWNHNAVLEPLALTEMGDQEREVCGA